MQIEFNKLDSAKARLRVELAWSEVEPFLKRGAREINKRQPLPGFRPGRATFELIEKQIGKDRLLAEVLEELVKKTFLQVLAEQNFEIVGQPSLNVIQTVWGEKIVYQAEFEILPEPRLPDLERISVNRRQISVDQEAVDKLLADIRKMRAKQKLVKRQAQLGDMVTVQMTVTIDKVPVEGGQEQTVEVYLGRRQMIPGFEEALVGLGENEEKTFTLKFPENYHQRTLAGRPADFKVKVKGVYEIIEPELTDDFARSLGNFSTLNDLRLKLQDNLKQEKQVDEEIRLEQEITEKLIAQTTFAGELPEVLIKHELALVKEEIQASVASHGVDFNNWLKNLGKDEEKFNQELRPQAEKRVKAAIIMRKLAKQQQIQASEEELQFELNRILQTYLGNQQIERQVKDVRFQEEIRQRLIVRKTMDWLKTQVVKG